jgi:hypothetical protein
MTASDPARPRPSLIAVVAGVVLGFVIGSMFVNRGDVRAAEQVLRDNIKAVDLEDRQAMIASFHRDSPFAEQAGEIFDRITPRVDVKAELVSFEPIAADGDLMVARYVQRTMAEASGSEEQAFVDNRISGLAVFRMQDGTPRIWVTVPIEASEIQAEAPR